jgi:hypothetical protein
MKELLAKMWAGLRDPKGEAYDLATMKTLTSLGSRGVLESRKSCIVEEVPPTGIECKGGSHR